jgi:hypothetical protein
MAGNVPRGRVADALYPTASDAPQEEGPKNWASKGFLWDENALFAWRGLAVFGGLLIVMGMLVWLGATGYDGFPLGPLVAMIAFCFLGSMFVAFLGRTEVALALIGAVVVGVVIAIFDPPSLLPSPGLLITNPSAAESNRNTVLALWIVGAALLAIGGTLAVRISRAIDDE